jgi:membrane protease YdiL (CAAX protease family)
MLPEEMPEGKVEIAVSEPAPARQPFWGYVDLAMVIGLLVALTGFIIAGVGVLGILHPSIAKDPVPILLPAQLGLYLAIYLALKITFVVRHDAPVFRSLGFNHNWTMRTLLVVAAGGLLLAPVVSGIASLLHTPEVDMDIMEMLQKSPVILALFGLMAISITPFFEELLFRGFLQPLFSRTLGVVAGIALTALLFGALHGPQYKMQWQYIGAIALVGAALGVVRYKTESIIPSTVMHACFNLVSVIALYLKHQ